MEFNAHKPIYLQICDQLYGQILSGDLKADDRLLSVRDLGIELVSFLPEIVAQQVVQFRDNDTLIPVVDRGKPEFELKKSQVRSFGYISDAVAQYLRKQRPTKDEIYQILALSAKFHALSEAIEKGAKLEDLRMSQLVYFVDSAYHIW